MDTDGHISGKPYVLSADFFDVCCVPLAAKDSEPGRFRCCRLTNLALAPAPCRRRLAVSQLWRHCPEPHCFEAVCLPASAAQGCFSTVHSAMGKKRNRVTIKFVRCRADCATLPALVRFLTCEILDLNPNCSIAGVIKKEG